MKERKKTLIIKKIKRRKEKISHTIEFCVVWSLLEQQQQQDIFE
jgi:hypothetical protein